MLVSALEIFGTKREPECGDSTRPYWPSLPVAIELEQVIVCTIDEKGLRML